MNSITVLLSSAGRRCQLLEYFKADAKVLNWELRSLAADLRPELSPACQQADAAFAVPRCTSDDYIRALLEICQRESVGLLVPTIDTELAVLSRQAESFTGIGTRVVISSPLVVDLARDKLATASLLAAVGVPTPQTLSLADYRANPAALAGPVIAKPKGGSSSVGIVRPKSPADLTGLATDDYIVQELWEGAEYTVNLFFDQTGALRCVVPHRRIEVRGGEVSKGRTERVPALIDAAHKLAAALPGARGPLCFQAIVRPDGAFCVFEINARFGGGYPLAHHAGATFTLWLLEEALGRPCTAHDNWRENVTMLRYDAAVFLEG